MKSLRITLEELKKVLEMCETDPAVESEVRQHGEGGCVIHLVRTDDDLIMKVII